MGNKPKQLNVRLFVGLRNKLLFVEVCFPGEKTNSNLQKFVFQPKQSVEPPVSARQAPWILGSGLRANDENKKMIQQIIKKQYQNEAKTLPKSIQKFDLRFHRFLEGKSVPRAPILMPRYLQKVIQKQV